jgi:PIN domain nuclease of toxin-antitoxin system
MRYLLDTHVLLWAATAPNRLSDEARALLENGVNDVFVSVVTGWEIAIKQSLAKLELSEPAERWLPQVITQSGFAMVELRMPAALRVRALPFHHRDPFDRLLIAQALEENFTVITHDQAFCAYGVSLLLT